MRQSSSHYGIIPHRGSLCRVDGTSLQSTYAIKIKVEGNHHELAYSKHDFEFLSRIFAILDTESLTLIHKSTIQEFVYQRCPVLAKRDIDGSKSIDEIWDAVVSCCGTASALLEPPEYIGLEGWMVLCRFIALAQYLEAKRRFSGRFLQQTMRHRNAPRGSEVVVVDVPPLSPPEELTPSRLCDYEQEKALPLPELDLDHSLLAAHENDNNGVVHVVKVALWDSDEFAVTFSKQDSNAEDSVVRRSMADMKWLDDTFQSHRVLGGTLCGRILPPFPYGASQEETTIIPSKTSAMHAAAAGVGRLSGLAKTLVGSYFKTDLPQSQPAKTLPEFYYNPHSGAAKARQLERYLNYLLEHPALSTSFPLNTILSASQSGVDAARLAIEDCNKRCKELNVEAAVESSIKTPNFAWVRTAAQAAVALRLHGMLETTGLQSASAKLQHASLPLLNHRPSSNWEDDDEMSETHTTPSDVKSSNFEEGVVNDDGFDLLPLPIPAPERRILTIGGTDNTELSTEERFHYGRGSLETLPVESAENSAFLGDISVDENIDKLREVIGSVDNTLKRCLTSVGAFGKAYKDRERLHLDVIRGLDCWPEMRGKFVSQRSLMKGVSDIDVGKEVREEGNLAFVEDLSWQTSLAGSAVSAAEDVRAAVRVSRTAANARAAASSAALTAQTACEEGNFAGIDEARAAQTRASIAQSHAIHATVVEHEAKTVKRRSTLALAHDVKTWNIHRKRDMLRACQVFCRSQHEATRRSVDAWSSLRDGFIRKGVTPSVVRGTQQPRRTSGVRRANIPEATTTVYESESSGIVAMDHDVFSRFLDSIPDCAEPTDTDVSGNDPAETSVAPASGAGLCGSEEAAGSVSECQQASSNGASSASGQQNAQEPAASGASSDFSPDSDEESDVSDMPPFSEDPFDFFSSPKPVESTNDSDKPLLSFDAPLPTGPPATVPAVKAKKPSEEVLLPFAEAVPTEPPVPEAASSADGDKMSSSMQSLVDALMNWGEAFDVDEDLALPAGMAASIALEENKALGG